MKYLFRLKSTSTFIIPCSKFVIQINENYFIHDKGIKNRRHIVCDMTATSILSEKDYVVLWRTAFDASPRR